MKSSVKVLALLALGCAPDYADSTLVVTLDAYEETQVAAQWWNDNTGTTLSVEQGTCHKEPCVVVMLGDCAELGPMQEGWKYTACALKEKEGAEIYRIEIQPALLEAYDRGELDLAQTLAHEIGHVVGHEHSSRPWNIMSTPGELMSWAVPY